VILSIIFASIHCGKKNSIADLCETQIMQNFQTAGLVLEKK